MVAGVAPVRLLFVQSAVHFDSIEHARDAILGLKLSCQTDAEDSSLANGFMVRRDESTPVLPSELCKSGPMGARWKGTVWVAALPRQAIWPTPTMPDDAVARVWGDVIVFGDGEFLDELEKRLRDQRGHTLCGFNTN
jgi:hypothetical protein